MSTILKGYVDRLVPSAPVFRINKSQTDRWSSKRSKIETVYEPDVSAVPDDPVGKVVTNCYHENFDCRNLQFTVAKGSIESTAWSHIFSSMRNFLQYNIPTKSPQNTKLYRWFSYEMSNSDQHRDAIVMIYKYIVPFCSASRMAIDDPKNEAHAKNALALIELIRTSHYAKRK